MTIGLEARRDGFLAQLDVDGRQLSALDDSGVKFTALLETIAEVDPDMPLGNDLREFTIAHCLNESAPTSNMVGLQVQDDSGQKWKVTKRENNPADFTIKFWLQKITTQDK